MISKCISSRSFAATCRYICMKQKAEVLYVEGVRGHDHRLMAADFERQRGLHPEKEIACLHVILSFHPTEKPADNLMVTLAKEYLQKLGITDTQFAIVRHHDRDHPHLHLVVNMVNNEGKVISDRFIELRGKKTAQALTEKYGLVPANEKNLALTHVENRNGMEATKYKIYLAISEELPYCNNMEELEGKLNMQGIGVQYKYRRGTEEKQGISFRSGEFSFRGSKVDRKFSLAGLEKALARIPERTNKEAFHGQQQKNITRDENVFYPESTTGTKEEKEGHPLADAIANQEGNILGNFLDTLLYVSPDSYGGAPGTDTPRRKRKKRKRGSQDEGEPRGYHL